MNNSIAYEFLSGRELNLILRTRIMASFGVAFCTRVGLQLKNSFPIYTLNSSSTCFLFQNWKVPNMHTRHRFRKHKFYCCKNQYQIYTIWYFLKRPVPGSCTAGQHKSSHPDLRNCFCKMCAIQVWISRSNRCWFSAQDEFWNFDFYGNQCIFLSLYLIFLTFSHTELSIAKPLFTFDIL